MDKYDSPKDLDLMTLLDFSQYYLMTKKDFGASLFYSEILLHRVSQLSPEDAGKESYESEARMFNLMALKMMTDHIEPFTPKSFKSPFRRNLLGEYSTHFQTYIALCDAYFLEMLSSSPFPRDESL